jgi:hypothetical protein
VRQLVRGIADKELSLGAEPAGAADDAAAAAAKAAAAAAAQNRRIESPPEPPPAPPEPETEPAAGTYPVGALSDQRDHSISTVCGVWC